MHIFLNHYTRASVFFSKQFPNFLPNNPNPSHHRCLTFILKPNFLKFLPSHSNFSNPLLQTPEIPFHQLVKFKLKLVKLWW